MNNTIAKKEIKIKVKKLRRLGKTYSEIINNIGIKIPKSTLSNWCKQIDLPDSYYNKITILNTQNIEKARELAVNINKKRRNNYLNRLILDNQTIQKILNKDVIKIALAMLYLGEGAKRKSHTGLQLGSSNPEIISLFLGMLKKCYNIDSDRLRCRVSYRADQNIDELQKFWSKVTGIPITQFYKTIPDPRTIGKKTRKSDYKGVCVISYCNAHIQLELEIISKLVLLGI